MHGGRSPGISESVRYGDNHMENCSTGRLSRSKICTSAEAPSPAEIHRHVHLVEYRPSLARRLRTAVATTLHFVLGGGVHQTPSSIPMQLFPRRNSHQPSAGWTKAARNHLRLGG